MLSHLPHRLCSHHLQRKHAASLSLRPPSLPSLTSRSANMSCTRPFYPQIPGPIHPALTRPSRRQTLALRAFSTSTPRRNITNLSSPGGGPGLWITGMIGFALFLGVASGSVIVAGRSGGDREGNRGERWRDGRRGRVGRSRVGRRSREGERRMRMV